MLSVESRDVPSKPSSVLASRPSRTLTLNLDTSRLPGLVDDYLQGKLTVDDYVTHTVCPSCVFPVRGPSKALTKLARYNFADFAR